MNKSVVNFSENLFYGNKIKNKNKNKKKIK